MRHLLRFASFLIQISKVIGFLLFKVFVEPAEQAAIKATQSNARPVIDLKPKPTDRETVTDTASEMASIRSDTVSETVAILTETVQETVGNQTQEPAIAVHELKPQIDMHKVCINDLTPQLELVKPQVQDLTPQLAIPKPAIQPVAISDIDRAAQVEETLERAWNEGITTYKELMEYVKQQTGKGCSRRVISEWKKSRNIAEFAS